MFGSNAHGFENEKNIAYEMKDKKYKNLSLNLKRFVSYIAKSEGKEINEETNINSRVETDNRKKQDLYVSIDEEEYAISIKMGSGNSTHQEKCEDFIKYIKEMFGASDTVCNDIRIMIWCDGTLDGSGDISNRMNKKEYILKYADGIERVRNFLGNYERELIERFLFVGNHNSKVDYIYHGTALNGRWISAKELIDYQLKNPKDLGDALVVIGRMNLQVWNRSLTGNSDKKRGQIQLKYPTLEADLENIMHSSDVVVGTFEGDIEEFNISKLMNKNKNSKLWKTIGHIEDNKDMYVAKVMYNVYSELAKRKVKPKTDAYIVSAKLDNKFLLEREYIITEEDLQKVDYDIVPETGISVKKRNSKKFTYEKMSRNSFLELFGKYIDNPDEIFCGLMLYQEDRKISLNGKIVEDCNCTIEGIIDNIKKNTGIYEASIYNKEDVRKFREYCEKNIRDIIENNIEVKEMIFTGKKCFEAPYYIDYILKNNELSKNIIPEKYQISNGSGRSKGKYTIIFKPL